MSAVSKDWNLKFIFLFIEDSRLLLISYAFLTLGYF